MPIDPGPLAPEVEKMEVEVEQIGERLLEVAFTRFVGWRKATTEIQVSRAS